MKIRKEELYVLAVVLAIVLIITALGDRINFSPGEMAKDDPVKEIWVNNFYKIGVSIGGSEEFIAALNNALRTKGLI